MTCNIFCGLFQRIVTDVDANCYSNQFFHFRVFTIIIQEMFLWCRSTQSAFCGTHVTRFVGEKKNSRGFQRFGKKSKMKEDLRSLIQELFKVGVIKTGTWLNYNILPLFTDSLFCYHFIHYVWEIWSHTTRLFHFRKWLDFPYIYWFKECNFQSCSTC